MPTYNVRWEGEIEADSSAEAAKIARAWQQEVNSSATLFSVENQADGELEIIDLSELDE